MRRLRSAAFPKPGRKQISRQRKKRRELLRPRLTSIEIGSESFRSVVAEEHFMVPIRERKTYSVLLADDLTLVREGLAALCAANSQYQVVGQCSEGVAALKLIQTQKPDLAVLDLNLPDLFTMEIVKRVREANIPTKIVVLSMRRDRKTVA